MTAVLGPGRPFTGTERGTAGKHTRAASWRTGGRRPGALRRPIASTARALLTTPISLIKYCAAAERIWFQRTLAAMAAEDCDGHSTGGDSSFYVTADETLAGVIAEYEAACGKSRQIAACHGLDDTAEHRLVGTVNLRFIYLCMIGDIARHAGQADILVEQIRASHHKV